MNTSVSDNPTVGPSQPIEMTKSETREIVTPYAFGVADSLLGKRLASPTRRGFAQLIDATLVVLLSSANALFLAFFVALTFFKAGKKAQRQHKRRVSKLLRIGGAFLLFFITYSVVQLYHSPDSIDVDEYAQSSIVSPVLGVVEKFAWKACDGDVSCRQDVAKEFGDATAETDTPRQEVLDSLNSALEGRDMSDEEKADYVQRFMAAFDERRERNKTAALPATEAVADQPIAKQPKIITFSASDKIEEQDQAPPQYSVVNWVKGVIADLGLGFGWAALYYSAFTAWWQGHTPGKRLLRIRVLKLDGSSLTLWESFGRYGGYGAGVATGLLGFLQVYWDPNRQAIQDKISETLVICDDQKTDEDKRTTISQRDDFSQADSELMQ